MITVEDILECKRALEQQEVPDPHYIIFPDGLTGKIGKNTHQWSFYYPETNTCEDRIILYPQDKPEDFEMTERTLKDVNTDIQQVQKKLQQRSMIIGPVWNQSIVSFEVDDGISEEPGVDWSEEFDKYLRGETSGEVVVHISTTGCDGDIRLGKEDFGKILGARDHVRMNELYELKRLRQERHKFQEIERAERELSKLKGEEQPNRNTMSSIDQILEDL